MESGSKMLEIEKELQKYQRAVEQSPSCVIITDTEGRIEYVNPRFEQLTGYSPEEVIGKTPRLFKSGVQTKEFYEQLWARILNGEKWQGEFVNRKKNGEIYWESASISPLRDSQGNITQFIKVSEDITAKKQAEENLRREQEFAIRLMETSPIGIVVLDKTGCITYVNNQILRISGFNRETLLSRSYLNPLWQLLNENEKVIPPQQGPVAQILTSRQPIYDLKLIARWTDKKSFFSLNGVPILDSSGEVESIILTLQDITEHQKAQELLTHSRDELEWRVQERTRELERSSALVHSLNRMGQVVTGSLDLDVVLYNVIDEAKNLLSVDAVSILLREEPDVLRFAAVSGERADQLINMRIPATAGVAGKVLSTGRPILIDGKTGSDLIYRGVDAKTGYHTETLLAVPLVFKGEAIGVLEAVNRQVSSFEDEDLQTLESVANWAAIAIGNARQYTKLQRRLMESEAITRIGQELLRALDQKRVLQMIVDAAKQLLPKADCPMIYLLNPKSEELVLAAATETDKTKTCPPLIQSVARKVLESGQIINIGDVAIHPWICEENQINSGSLLMAPVQSGSEVIGVISVSSDDLYAFSQDDEQVLSGLGLQTALAIQSTNMYTDLQNALRQEQMSRAQLVQGEKLAALGRIVASVAHELNNPLQAIQNALFLIKMEGLPNSQTQEDLEVALREVERMADLIARLRDTYRPVMREDFQPENINDLVIDVQKLLATHLRHQKINFVVDLSPEIPAIPMIRDQIKQVLLNLSLNAVEAMKHGGTLSIKTYRAEDNGIMLEVRDNGPGIAPDILPFIFDPFFTTKEGGTGLGLSITYDIVQRHKGKIQVKSDPGIETTFCVWLPGVAN